MTSATTLQRAAACYARFLPAELRAPEAPEPQSTWWQWRGHSVHIARARRPEARVRVLVAHGGGGWSGALWPLAAGLVGDAADIAAPDLPLYGLTQVPDAGAVRYQDWVDLLVELVEAEDDGRPLLILGASMGGLLGYEVAARAPGVAGLLVTCLLDPHDRRARQAAARFRVLGGADPRLLSAVSTVMGGLQVPIRWLADVGAMSGNPALSRLCASDPHGGGARVPLAFLTSWFTFDHARPESFTRPPIHLLHPGADAWTPPSISLAFLSRVAAPTAMTPLENCGHFPIEPPGVLTMRRVVQDTLRTLATPALP